MKEVSKRAWIAGIMLISLMTRSGVAQDIPAVKEAKRLLEMDQPKKAIAAFEEAAKANPTDATVLYALGNAQLKTGEPRKAEISFQKGLEVNPKEAVNLAGKGQIRMSENNTAEAKTLFDQALAATKSKSANVLKAVAEGYLYSDKLANDAINLLQKAKSLNNADPETYMLLGDAYLKINDGGKAVSNYENAGSSDAKSALPHYKIGLVYLRSKNYDVAEQSFKKAIQLDPNYTLAYKELGELYYQKGSKTAAEAVSAYENYMRLTENPEGAKLRMAFFYFMAKDYKKANAMFNELSTRKDVNTTVWKYYAYSLVESGDFTKAEEVFNKYFSVATPAEIQAKDYVYFGKMLQKQGKDSVAIDNFKKSLKLEKDPEIALIIADTYFTKLKKYDKAIPAYNQLDSIKGKLSSQELFSLGKSYYYTSQYGKADTTFQKLIVLQPNMTVVYVWQARSVANLDPEVNGKIKGLAKPIFEQVIEKGQANPEKSKNDLIEAYSYMAYYHVTRDEVTQAKEFMDKVLAIDPNNKRAIDFMNEMKKAAAAQKAAQNPKK